MTARIETPMLHDTEQLMIQILTPLVNDDARIAFLCPAGDGSAIMQRVRVMIARRRKAREAQGKKNKKFRLHNTIHPETHSGKRYDCIVVWRVVGETHVMTQELEDILGG